MPWERLLWRGHSLLPPRTQYGLTDLRLVRIGHRWEDELAIYDLGAIQTTRSWVDRLLRTSTLIVTAREHRRAPLVLRHIRRAAEVAAVLDLLVSEPHHTLDAEALRSALLWQPSDGAGGSRGLVVGLAALLVALTLVAIGLHGQTRAAIAYPANDAIVPGGVKRDEEQIMRFMELTVMPWARTALAPIVGGEDRVACTTCHGTTAADQGWVMPAVAALPSPVVRQLGWERYGGEMDAQMRNAIYGYSSQSDKQSKASYMQEVVMPGMAQLLHRPAYDFTRTYEYNRTHLAFGCYHCHRVPEPAAVPP
jgi:hypothetical protein